MHIPASTSWSILTLCGAALLTGCPAPDSGNFGGGGGGDLGVPTGGGGGDSDGGTDGGTDSGTSDGGTDGGSTADGGTDGGTEIVIEGTGYGAGDIAYDLAGTDQTGSPWNLHSRYGSPVVLIVGHMDDPSFKTMMGWLGSVSGASVVAVVGRDDEGIQSDQADASTWAATYGVSTVVSDTTGELVNTWAERNPPKTYVIGADMEIFWTQFGTVSQIQVEDKLDRL